MKPETLLVSAVALGIIAASVMFSREAFVPDAPSQEEGTGSPLEYVSNESYQAFKTLGIDAATRNVLRALADVVQGKFVEGAYPSEDARLHFLTQAHEVAYNLEHGVSTYETIVHPGAREKVSEADYAASVERHRADYADIMKRSIFDEYGTMAELADARCPDAATARKPGVRWILARRCGA